MCLLHRFSFINAWPLTNKTGDRVVVIQLQQIFRPLNYLVLQLVMMLS